MTWRRLGGFKQLRICNRKERCSPRLQPLRVGVGFLDGFEDIEDIVGLGSLEQSLLFVKSKRNSSLAKIDAHLSRLSAGASEYIDVLRLDAPRVTIVANSEY